MSPEIEKLIKYAVADGEATEKERAVIMRKAESLGEDLDEVEMILNGELALIKKQPLHPKSNKEGDLKKCPSCGAPVPSLSLKCLECGHEFRNTEATLSINEFFKQVKSAKPDDRAIIISNFPIPNNKEDLIEFISMSVGNSKELSDQEKMIYFENKGFAKTAWKPELQIRLNEINAWRGKANAAIMKANILFVGNLTMLEYLKKFEDQVIENKTNKPQINKPMVFVAVILFILGIIAMVIGSSL